MLQILVHGNACNNDCWLLTANAWGWWSVVTFATKTTVFAIEIENNRVHDKSIFGGGTGGWRLLLTLYPLPRGSKWLSSARMFHVNYTNFEVFSNWKGCCPPQFWICSIFWKVVLLFSSSSSILNPVHLWTAADASRTSKTMICPLRIDVA